MKTVRGIRLSAPDVPGFPDRVQIFNGATGDMLIYDCPRFGTNPNPEGPSNGPNAGKKWFEFEGQLAPASIPFICSTSPKHGKCLILNPTKNANGAYSGGPVVTTRPNAAHGGKMIASLVECHSGYRGVASGRPWRGSLCCQVTDPDDWTAFIGHFELNETGVYILVDETAATV